MENNKKSWKRLAKNGSSFRSPSQAVKRTWAGHTPMTARIKLKRASLQQTYWRTKDRNCKHFRNASSTWSFARRHRHRYTSQESYTYIKMLNGGVYRLQKWLVCRCQHIFQYQNYTVQNVQELSLFLSLPSISLFEDCHLRVRQKCHNQLSRERICCHLIGESSQILSIISTAYEGHLWRQAKFQLFIKIISYPDTKRFYNPFSMEFCNVSWSDEVSFESGAFKKRCSIQTKVCDMVKVQVQVHARSVGENPKQCTNWSV